MPIPKVTVPVPVTVPVTDYGYSQDRNRYGYPTALIPPDVEDIRRLLYGPRWWRWLKGAVNWGNVLGVGAAMVGMAGGWTGLAEIYLHRHLANRVVDWVLGLGLWQAGLWVSVACMMFAAGGWLLEKQRRGVQEYED